MKIRALLVLVLALVVSATAGAQRTNRTGPAPAQSLECVTVLNATSEPVEVVGAVTGRHYLTAPVSPTFPAIGCR